MRVECSSRFDGPNLLSTYENKKVLEWLMLEHGIYTFNFPNGFRQEFSLWFLDLINWVRLMSIGTKPTYTQPKPPKILALHSVE